MARAIAISKILQTANDLPTKEEQIVYLKQKGNSAVITILKYALDNVVVWNLPEGNPPYKPCQFDDQEGMLHAEARRLYLFINDTRAPAMRPLKREGLYIELLQSIDPEDAKLLLAAKNKSLPYPKLTVDVINEAFPGLLIDPVEHPKQETKKKGKKKKNVEEQSLS